MGREQGAALHVPHFEHPLAVIVGQRDELLPARHQPGLVVGSPGREGREQLARLHVPAPDAPNRFGRDIVIGSAIRQHMEPRVHSRVVVDPGAQIQPARQLPPFPAAPGRRSAVQVAPGGVDLPAFERVRRAEHTRGVGLAQGVGLPRARRRFRRPGRIRQLVGPDRVLVGLDAGHGGAPQSETGADQAGQN